jgi:quinol monooxygenase YgiN
MYGGMFKLTVKPQRMDEVLAHLAWAESAARHEEPETLRFDVWRDPGDEHSLIVCECYTNAGAFEEHTKSEPYLRFSSRIVPDMATLVDIVPFADGFEPAISFKVRPLSDSDRQVLLAVYQELCRSHHAISDFRARLLALLPLATGAGAFVLFKDSGLQSWSRPIGIVGAIVTLGLFLYELRQVRECVQLRLQGAVLEDDLGVPDHCGPFRDNPSYGLRGLVTAEYAGWVVYGAVIASWLYIGLSEGSDGPVAMTSPQWIMVSIIVFGVLLKGVWLLWETRTNRPISLWLASRKSVIIAEYRARPGGHTVDDEREAALSSNA